MLRNHSELAHGIQIIGLLAVTLGGGIWLGQVDANAAAALFTSGKVEAIQIDQAVIREQIRRDGEKRDKHQRKTGERYNKKLDELLQEIRRRNTRGR